MDVPKVNTKFYGEIVNDREQTIYVSQTYRFWFMQSAYCTLA